MRNKCCLLGLTFAILLTAAPAHAQSTASYLRSVISVDQVIFITGPDGRELKGIVASISDTGLEMRMAGSIVPYRLQDVRMIEVADPIINGLLVGALIGSFVGSLPAWDADHSRSSALVSTLVLGAIGGAAGAWFDVLREGRKTIYRGSVIASVAPVLTPRTIGVSAAIRW